MQSPYRKNVKKTENGCLLDEKTQGEFYHIKRMT